VRCGHAPIFMRFTVRVYYARRASTRHQFTEGERARVKFSSLHRKDVDAAVAKRSPAFAGGSNAFASIVACRGKAMLRTSARRAAAPSMISRGARAPPNRTEIFAKMTGVLLLGGRSTRVPTAAVSSGYERGIMSMSSRTCCRATSKASADSDHRCDASSST